MQFDVTDSPDGKIRVWGGTNPTHINRAMPTDWKLAGLRVNLDPSPRSRQFRPLFSFLLRFSPAILSMFVFEGPPFPSPSLPVVASLSKDTTGIIPRTRTHEGGLRYYDDMDH